MEFVAGGFHLHAQLLDLLFRVQPANQVVAGIFEFLFGPLE